MESRTAVSSRPAIPRTVWALGLVSLLMDLSSELVHALLPVYLVTTMGMSVVALGVLEGAAEATALIVRIFSGAISDWLGRRKALLLAGYGLAALTKPLFPLAHGPGLVIAARVVDRFGKGIRGAPRDALVADVAPPEIRGACYGLRQSMDTVGAVGGPLLAIALMFAFADHIRAVLWFASIPAFATLAVLLFGVREPAAARADRPRPFRSPLDRRALRMFSARYWYVVAIGATFTLARFSEAFLVLRAQQTGMELAWVPSVMVVMSLAYTLSAYPVGVVSDRLDRRALLAIGMALLIAADLLLGAHADAATVLTGVAVWGLHMGFTQGILAAMVADTAPAEWRGTAFGLFNLASGVAMLLASAIAGWIWQRFGAPAMFFTGAAIVVVPLAMCAFAPGRPER
ncbi:MFS transporter [Burkholderia ubonensis]|uniref:MFS transporter n=1 Tax=Burkholderia ubonensis TaxID=101571 RepID=A0AB74DHB2_9BURK|nr:MFS transporter [Burkholderia ubonensis]PAJ80601.1 MFS transporter [Burkholderia ubonensis]PAK01009.1 MFS transporter [Burkholderia ubonensis]PAK12976.1 MFS transporter [Burkholderia ubonensis]RQP83471.1 MFS transporter [Burkholderia ubonensis]RQP90779.1 MFS transporter [Burkholderia ubonensis]